MSSKEALIRKLVNEYDEDENELKELSIAELRERLEEYEDHSDLFPNGDEFDGSHFYD